MKTYCVAVTSTQWGIGREVNKWDRINNLEIDAHRCAQLIFDRGIKGYSIEESIFNK